MSDRPATVDEYLATVEDAQRGALQALREQICTAAPDAEECISYGQPAFRQGRIVCGFGATRNHCALYMFSNTSLEPFVQELKGFDTSKGTIRFQPDRPLPAALVRRLVKSRLAENAASKNKTGR